MINICIFASIEDCFNFGKFKGFSLSEVLDIDPSYLEWCVKHCDGVYFLLSPSAISEIKSAYPEFHIDENFENLCSQRFNDYFAACEEGFEDDYGDIDELYNHKDTYERYSGSYAQDEMGYSDDDIDTIFEGDPDAYWNID